METKQISFGEFDNQASDYLSELVSELLLEKDIYTDSFAFSIEVEYVGKNTIWKENHRREHSEKNDR
jgi:hypothetical protein